MPARKYPFWTPAEDDVLRANYTRRNAAKRIHELLPLRPCWDIVKRANGLGLVTRVGAYFKYTLGDLLDRVVIDEKTGCWNWTRAIRTKRTGYGVVKHDGVRVNAHRLAFSLANPDVDISKCLVCHHCDNRLCINPEHLYAGTYADNNRDTVKRGHYRNQYGPLNESV